MNRKYFMGASMWTSRPSDIQRHLPHSETNYVLGEWINTHIVSFLLCGFKHSYKPKRTSMQLNIFDELMEWTVYVIKKGA